MEATIVVTLNRDEVERELPYRIIVETFGGARWDTRKRRQLQKEWFTEQEERQLKKIYTLARSWYLIKGVPEEVQMTAKEILLFQKFADFCASI